MSKKLQSFGTTCAKIWYSSIEKNPLIPSLHAKSPRHDWGNLTVSRQGSIYIECSGFEKLKYILNSLVDIEDITARQASCSGFLFSLIKHTHHNLEKIRTKWWFHAPDWESLTSFCSCRKWKGLLFAASINPVNCPRVMLDLQTLDSRESSWRCFA